jgi:hypothetical protein
MREYYVKYCKILSRIIKAAKRKHYCRLIAKSDNQKKRSLDIIKHETGKSHLTEQIPSLLINEEKVNDPEVIADAFDTFFLTINENLNMHQEVRCMPFQF